MASKKISRCSGYTHAFVIVIPDENINKAKDTLIIFFIIILR
jgi:hypothetical protein